MGRKRPSGVAGRQAQSAFLRGTSNPNLKLFIARQCERTAEESVVKPNTSGLAPLRLRRRITAELQGTAKAERMAGFSHLNP
jgi:hypothetical protein